MSLLSKKSQTNLFILHKVDEHLRAISWENQPTWNMTTQNLLILSYFVPIIGLINLSKSFSHPTNISGFMALCFSYPKSKNWIFQNLSTKYFGKPTWAQGFCAFSTIFLHEITPKNNPMFVPRWAGRKIRIENCQNCDENPDFMVKNTPMPTQPQCFYLLIC